MSTQQQKFNINGLIDTSRTVMDNIEGIASAVGAFATFDIHQGKWAFVLNETTTPVYDFDDSNIIGAISVSGNGLTETYNSVEVRFPHKDLNDQKDYRRVSIPREQWYPNERPNRLTINVDYINDPVQAEMMALRELKQSRMDKIIEFTTDFNALGLNAGDIIRVTNDYIGFSNKQFRIIQISEEDDEEGLINLRITGLEWSSDIDNYGTITRFIRDRDTGIQIIEQNTDIQGEENKALTAQNFTQLFPITLGLGASVVEANLATWGSPALGGTYNYATGVRPTISFTTPADFTNLTVIAGGIQASMKYEYYDNSTGSVLVRSGFFAYAPVTVDIVKIVGNAGSVITSSTMDWQTNSVTFNLTNVTAGEYLLRYTPLNTYDLNQSIYNQVAMYDWQVNADSAGNGISATLLGFNVG
jgi:hypothetical protein